ncbi:stage V sporulation protein AE [Hazenella coriacea]|uniref:Stage V sporulation protein AE n=1 Tax=Hazenella coriacea TaxID=1179467 RepID=A0A4R3L1Z6_9BACL|nr:stage V sporulation protein AE [Hazenella coriacea]TCS93459.1 stage V sporulation protein AE [Hazenella coriacea]
MAKRKVILITDGDTVAKETIEEVAQQVGGRCISRSAGNPTPLSGFSLVDLIKEALHDPVLVMFDDCGSVHEGDGEKALKIVATHPDIEVLGAIAVASNCPNSKGIPVQFALDRFGQVVKHRVDKYGNVMEEEPPHIYGDTVEVLNDLSIPIIIGMGDVGKMGKRDNREIGAPVTRKAVQLILEHHQKNYLHKNKTRLD